MTIGITSWGRYVPRWRLDRETAVSAMAWHAPPLFALKAGSRSVCNHDEDTLTMAVAAARAALSATPSRSPSALYLCSTTLPFEERLSAAVVKTALGLDDAIIAVDITGTRRAGVSGIGAALDRVAAAPSTCCLVTAADQRLARPGSTEELLFGDGAAAVVIGDTDVIAARRGRFTVTRDIIDRYRRRGAPFDYAWEDRWIAEAGFETAIPEVVAGLLQTSEVSLDSISKIVFPCPSPKLHNRIGQKIGCRPDQIADPLLTTIGETGAPHPLLLLTHALDSAKAGDRVIVVGFGSGAEAFLFEVTPQIDRRPQAAPSPASRYLSQYTQFLAYRGLLSPETGVRGEKPQKTALSVLYRERDALLGLVGAKCGECGTPQFPSGPHCVNPSCRASGSFTPYRFAHRRASLKTFTGDYLVPSPAPPHLYGLIQFDGGGRMMAELTDCRLEDLHAGMQLTMSFRKRYEDDERGFPGYFWKAVPIAEVPE